MAAVFIPGATAVTDASVEGCVPALLLTSSLAFKVVLPEPLLFSSPVLSAIPGSKWGPSEQTTQLIALRLTSDTGSPSTIVHLHQFIEMYTGGLALLPSFWWAKGER